LAEEELTVLVGEELTVVAEVELAVLIGEELTSSVEEEQYW
jgi:hypothetical protein